VHQILKRLPLLAAGLALLLVAAVGAAAATKARDKASRTTADIRKATDSPPPASFSPSKSPASDVGPRARMQHGEPMGHLPPSSANVDLIGELEPTDEFGAIAAGQIADLAVGGGFAYLNSWNEPTCDKGGTYVVDIRNPADPNEVDFINALPGNYHGEGADLLEVDTKDFTGTLLAVNNEHCTFEPVDTSIGGGFDLYDVTNPNNPKTLIQGWGDQGGEGQMSGGQPSNTYHSAFMWEDDGKVYLVGTDNEELHDVDIWDITNPRRPKAVAEYDLAARFPQILQTGQFPRLNEVFNHDMIVKEIEGRQVMLDSYWDAGYVMLDVENPAKASYVGDSDFETFDPLVPNISPPEGNAHQAEFSQDNEFFLGADEDFNPYRSDKFFVNDAERPAVEVPGGLSPASLPDQTLSGKGVYGGYGCPLGAPVPQSSEYSDAELDLQPGDERILILQRGPDGDPSADFNGNGDLSDDACFPGEKAAVAFDAGWDAVLLVNRHLGSDDSTSVPFCGSGGEDPAKLMVMLCTTHAAFHELFGSPPRFSTGDYPETDIEIGEVSVGRVRGTSVFDGWGYVSLFRREEGKVERIDSYAIPEALNPAFAFGFGDLSIHEVAMDPDQNRAYSSYYAGGMRVFDFGEGGIEEIGHYVDDDGSNFWGVETFVPRGEAAGDLAGERLFAGSDRDFGIQIFRYTGD
jgi:hypothetical protein